MYNKVLKARTVNQMLRYLTASYNGKSMDSDTPLYAVAEALPKLPNDSIIVFLSSQQDSNWIRHVIVVDEEDKLKVDRNNFLYSSYKDGIYTYKPVGLPMSKYYPRYRMSKKEFIDKSGIKHIGNNDDNKNN